MTLAKVNLNQILASAMENWLMINLQTNLIFAILNSLMHALIHLFSTYRVFTNDKNVPKKIKNIVMSYQVGESS